MARIASDEVERLKKDVSLERLATAAGVELKRHGADLLGRCPFHDDRTPSLVVSPEKNLWHCLGACQVGGSVIDWVMKAHGVSFRHAVELLREEHPSLAAPLASAVKHSTVRKLAAPVTHDADDRAALGQVIDFYHATLKQSPEALAYLKKRGLDAAEMINRFKLGFANRTLGLRLPERNRQAGAEIRGRLIKLGLYRESGHEHFNGSLVIPVLDETGAVSEIYGRKITDGLRPGTPLHLYLPGPHRGVWNREALKASKEIIVCEALIDALTFWCAGYRNVTASYGVEGFTVDHLAAFNQHETKRVLIAYDRDDAGDGAAEKLAAKLMAEGIQCFRVQFPKGMDANEYALKVVPAQKSLGLVLRHAVWMGQGAAPARDIETSSVAIAEPPPREDAQEVTPGPQAASSLAAETPVEAEAASPLPPPSPPPEVPTEVKAEEVVITLGERRYRIRGMEKNLAFDVLRVNILAARGDNFYVDTFDLYSAKQRASFIKQAAQDLGLEDETIKKDLGKVLLKLEALQEQQIHKTLEPKEKTLALSDAEQDAALELLRDPRLLERILADFRKAGIVGEEVNKLVSYIAAVSRKLEQPLAVIIQSTSAAGKSSLMEAVLALMPEEDKVKYSAMTGQSLFYMGETDLKHRILAIVEEEGAAKASYALKLLQSEGELTIASTGKDPETGRLITHEYRVEGPVMIFLTTTAVEIDEELLNRCLVLSVNEDREQTRAIHDAQRQAETLEGMLARKDKARILKLHKDAQRLLRPLLVTNPYAKKLTFLDHRTRTRRDHQKYLTLIRSIALLHQYQRPIKSTLHGTESVPFIEVSLDDIAIANELAHQVLGRSLDELPPQTRRFLILLDKMVTDACAAMELDRGDYRFSRRQAREHTGWGYTQTKIHLERLIELEFVAVHRGRNGQSFVYELCYDGRGQDGAPFLMGLIDVAALSATTETLRGSGGDLAARLRGALGPLSATLRSTQNAAEATIDTATSVSTAKTARNAHLVAAAESYRSSAVLPLAAMSGRAART
ncbi:MAG: toprim domain-containing protein [Deltaproteobacteria bacterium]|nr:toprim domain-containing protein [Deltaproteobacteria bacterium]